jgi:hypothetical protein
MQKLSLQIKNNYTNIVIDTFRPSCMYHSKDLLLCETTRDLIFIHRRNFFGDTLYISHSWEFITRSSCPKNIGVRSRSSTWRGRHSGDQAAACVVIPKILVRRVAHFVHAVLITNVQYWMQKCMVLKFEIKSFNFIIIRCSTRTIYTQN